MVLNRAWFSREPRERINVWFLSCFGLKTGIDFDHYGLKSGMVFKGTTGAYKRMVFELFWFENGYRF